MKVLRGGTLIDGTGAGPLAAATVVVRDQRIEAVTTRAGNGDWPSDAEVIDVSGMTILPGLIDCHDHMAMHGYDLARRWGIDEPRSTRALRTPKCCKTPSRRATPRCATRRGSTPASSGRSMRG